MEVDWREVVDLELRGARRADLSYRSSPFATGSLANMVRRALARDDREQQKVVIASARLGRLEIEQIITLAARPDFPRS